MLGGIQCPWRNRALSLLNTSVRDWYLLAEQPAPAPHLARPEGRAALPNVLVTAPRVTSVNVHAASVRGGNTFGCKDFSLKAKAEI